MKYVPKIYGYEYLYWIYSKYVKGKPLMEDGNKQYKDMRKRICSGEGFVYGKIGGFELYAMRVAEFGYKSKINDAYDHLCRCAGFFSNNCDKKYNLTEFSNYMKDAISNSDYLVRWLWPRDEYFMIKYALSCKNSTDYGMGSDIYPIGKLIEGMKVLVISPFSKSVEHQYEIREKLYKNPERLSNFELRTFQSVLSIGTGGDERFSDWFEALEYMKNEVKKIDFDVALVGCGAYSLPLCSFIKKMGKCAMHMGGYLQLLFGIMGTRWEKEEYVIKLKNEYWKRPYDFEIPKEADLVEGRSYW